jgi:predicted transcriptional regulator of viral defense system
MSNRTRLSIAKPDIIQSFNDYGKSALAHSDISQILGANRNGWRLAQSTTVNGFLDYLLSNTQLTKWRAGFPKRPVIRYVWKNSTLFELVQSINSEGYFSHFSAMAIHGLSEQLPKTIYFNIEQLASGGEGELSQAGIDRAFKANCRVSKNIATISDQRICLLSGKNTASLGVVLNDSEIGKNLRITNLERTLIDLTVRPIYSGGIFEVARAFEQAANQVSINRLCMYLRRLKFVYPYHQAIGFYMEHCGKYSATQLKLLRQFPMNFDFYLAHGLRDTHYVKNWRLHVPKGF